MSEEEEKSTISQNFLNACRTKDAALLFSPVVARQNT